jgi:hypothetical protein
VPAGGKKERNAARHARIDLCVERLEVYLEQRPKQHGHGNEIKEEPRRRCEAFRGEGRTLRAAPECPLLADGDGELQSCQNDRGGTQQQCHL